MDRMPRPLEAVLEPTGGVIAMKRTAAARERA
jgi:hypothetical protein